MSLVGFIYNFREGTYPDQPYFSFRAVPMAERLEELGAKLFIYSRAQVDPVTGTVLGYFIEDGRFVRANAPVPKVNGSWYLGSNKSTQTSGMTGSRFRAWAQENGCAIYPNASFTRTIKDKFQTGQLVARIDPGLHPYTELYTAPGQLDVFLGLYNALYLKPRTRRRRRPILVLRRDDSGLSATRYDKQVPRRFTFGTLQEAAEEVSRMTSGEDYVIQEAVEPDRVDDRTFILRVIMVDDGSEWHWIGTGVPSEKGSDIADSRANDVYALDDLFTRFYGGGPVDELVERVRKASFDATRYLTAMFQGELMEVAYDFVMDVNHNARIVRISTQPRMAKPDIPLDNAFVDIFNRTPEEQVLYQKHLVPHGAPLGSFLHAKMKEREAEDALRPPSAAEPAAAISTVQPAEPGGSESPDSAMGGPEEAEIQAAIGRAADYIIRACQPDGLFTYRINLNPSVKIKRKYNELRHAGTIYALACYDRHVGGSEKARQAIRRSTRFLKEHFLAPIPDRPDLTGFWSRPQLNGTGAPDQVKLGGAGLALVALLSPDRSKLSEASLEELRMLGRFILFAQKPDGGFHAKYIPSEGGLTDQWISLYYPGEAALGLLMLHEKDTAPEWAEGAARAIGFLAASREGEVHVPADHWALLATEKLLPVYDSMELPIPREAIVSHAVQVCESMLREQVWVGEDLRFLGGFAADGRTTPTATRLEGLLAALNFLAGGPADLLERLAPAVDEGISFLVRAQIQGGDHTGGFPRATAPRPDSGSTESRRHNRRMTEVRIDYVQHALCALIQYHRLRWPDRT